MLDKEFEYYKSHQEELVAKYRGRFVVIRDQKVIGDYSSELEALTESKKNYEMGTFLIQYADTGKSNYTQTFHSRVTL